MRGRERIGQSHWLGANNRGTRRRVMTAGVAAPLVGRNCVGDMCHCSNSTALHLLLALAVLSTGIPLFGQGDDRVRYTIRLLSMHCPEYSRPWKYSFQLRNDFILRALVKRCIYRQEAYCLVLFNPIAIVLRAKSIKILCYNPIDEIYNISIIN